MLLCTMRTLLPAGDFEVLDSRAHPAGRSDGRLEFVLRDGEGACGVHDQLGKPAPALTPSMINLG
jgi:hypothetical protein